MDTLSYLANIEHAPELGILTPIPLDKKSPIVLRNMTREHLAKLFKELGYKVGVEIGVSRGEYSHCLWKANPESVIYGIDPWQVYAGYEEPYTKKRMEECYEETLSRLDGTSCILIRKFSMEAALDFDSDSLDFVYIDGNHEFMHVASDIAVWSDKVRPGGIVSGHDYARYKREAACHVKDVVNSWTYSHGIHPWFVLRGKSNSSWFWVKK